MGLKRIILKWRLPLVVAAHLSLILISNYLSFWLRFDGQIPERYKQIMVEALPWLLVVRGCSFLLHRLYKGLWRYTGIWDLWNIISASVLGSIVFFILIHGILGQKEYPRSVFALDTILLVFFLGGLRLPWRIYRELNRREKKGKRVLIYGAGDAGEMIARDMKQHPEYRYDPVGFIDDDGSKVGQSIHGLPVFGKREALPKVIEKKRIDEVVVAIPSALPSTMRDLLKSLEPFNIPIKTTPNLRDILDERVTVNEIRNLSVEDLMTRRAVNMDLNAVKSMLKGKRVLVTGAGGSIGSELCRQIAALDPSELILFERYENGLYDIANELIRTGHKDIIRNVIGDVTDRELVNRLFQIRTPEVIFHAAAHKHVPLMQFNPCEAIKNNVAGTRVLSKAAVKHGVGKFVMISTDKAVNPTSIMGASKRVAEMIVNAMADHSMTSFVAVRFGNVLGSKGSVVPLWVDQIKRHGPVTVTHPDMQRYFMLIPEAVELVLLASAVGGDAVTYVLQMGEQINVTEMARNLIRLSGFVPDVEIPIVYTGLRPGEKLFEELVAHDEVAEPCAVKEILKIRKTGFADSSLLRRKVRELEKAAFQGDSSAVVACLRELIPNFAPADGSVVSSVSQAAGENSARPSSPASAESIERQMAG
jgi:FlaA1/EpsC-like NDP-sugar epimerase